MLSIFRGNQVCFQYFETFSIIKEDYDRMAKFVVEWDIKLAISCRQI